jgi:hypothetical protein
VQGYLTRRFTYRSPSAESQRMPVWRKKSRDETASKGEPRAVMLEERSPRLQQSAAPSSSYAVLVLIQAFANTITTRTSHAATLGRNAIVIKCVSAAPVPSLPHLSPRQSRAVPKLPAHHPGLGPCWTVTSPLVFCFLPCFLPFSSHLRTSDTEAPYTNGKPF